MSETTNPNLVPHRVILHEEPGDTFKLVFDCKADYPDHAVEQAEKAYPGCEIILCLSSATFDYSQQRCVIFSPSESVASHGAGFWSNELGWSEVESATQYSNSEMEFMSLPFCVESDAKWVLLEDAQSSNPPSKSCRIRLTIDVTYALNGESVLDMERHLRKACEYAIGRGMLTGAADARADAYKMDIKALPKPLSEKTLDFLEEMVAFGAGDIDTTGGKVLPKLPMEDEIAGFMLQRIESGDMALEDIPRRLARFGLADPLVFAAEMLERMELAKDDMKKSHASS